MAKRKVFGRKSDNMRKTGRSRRQKMEDEALAEIKTELLGWITGQRFEDVSQLREPLPFPNRFFQDSAQATFNPTGRLFPMFSLIADLVRDPTKGTKKEREDAIKSLQRVLANDAAGVDVGDRGQPVVTDVGPIAPPRRPPSFSVAAPSNFDVGRVLPPVVPRRR